MDAMHVEQNMIKEHVGSQDQVVAAFGGLNKIVFGGPQKITVYPVVLPSARLQLFQDHLMLFFTGFTRIASEVAEEQIKNTPLKKSELDRMRATVDEAIEILNGDGKLDEFGHLLHEAWQIKKSLTQRISNTSLDTIYDRGRKAGALGGKILGAGGGGFMLFFVLPENREKVRQALSDLLYVPFAFENLGSQIIYYAPTEKHPRQ